MSRSTLKTSAINAEIRKAHAAAAAPAAPAGKKATAKDKPAAAAPKGAGEIRIIGGAWKRTRLPVAQRPGLRPTNNGIWAKAWTVSSPWVPASLPRTRFPTCII